MVNDTSKPLLVMFAGPNGSGKSTITPIFQNQSDFPQKYINPDEIALTLGGNTMEKAYEASAIAAQERLNCIDNKQSFSFETVMSHPSKLAILETAKKAGFETRLVYISTGNPQTNVDRVKQRVIDGGHDVPENKVISRYHRSLSLLPKASEIADKTYIFDNTNSSRLGVELSQGEIIEKPGTKIEWVEKTITTLNERQQERLSLLQRYSNIMSAPLDRSEHTGKIEAVDKHLTVQQTNDGQVIIHENSIVNLDKSAIGHDVLISYSNGVHDINIPELSLDKPQALENTLFELVSSAKYLALNEGIEKIDSDNQKVYNIPGGVNIEKDRDSLSISYKDKSVQFDRDFNVLKNELSDFELRRINQQIQVIKQNSIEQSRSKQIEQDIDRDM